MKISSILISTTCILLVAINAFGSDDNPPSRRDTKRSSTAKGTQVSFAAIIVNGRTLTGPNSSAQTHDGQLLIPVASLARAIGDVVQVNAESRSLTVKRQTGTHATYDSRLGQVAENGAVVLSVPNLGATVLSPYIEEILLPSGIVSALFDASLRYDRVRNVVFVTRGVTGAVTQQKAKRGIGEIYSAEYTYDLNRYSATNSHNLTLSAVGRLADGRFSFTSNSNGTTPTKLLPRNVNFTVERPNGQRYVAGDFGSGSALQLMTSNIRGAMASVPVGNFTFAAFGGRANSGTFSRGVTDYFPQQVRTTFDTDVSGISATTKPFESGTLKPLILSAGAMRFGGSTRRGNLVSTSANYGGYRTQFQADFGIGTFKGRSLDDRVADGTGIAVDLAGSFQAADNLSFQGRFVHIGSNFLAPQAGIREPVDLKAAGVSWSPIKWLTTSVNASRTRRPNETGHGESFISTTVAVSPGGTKPQFYISHIESSSKSFRRGEFTLVNFSKSFRQFRFFVNGTRVKNIGPASVNTQFGANILVSEKNTLEINQGFSNHGSYNGLTEWRTDGLFKNRLNVSAGVGYNYSQNAKLNTYEKLTASLNLPRASSLQLSYLQTSQGPTLLVRLRGTLFRKRDASSYLNSMPDEVNNFTSVSGRVYQDIDGNGKYDLNVDKTQANVKVRVDGNHYVETDANGLFAFDAVTAGEHKIYVDLLSVRADLTLLDSGSQILDLAAGKHTVLDFRLARTGRIAGRLFMDANNNGKLDDGESPLSDIRIVTGSDRDTLTDADGYFTIADLAPGEHELLIDEKTLPEKTIPATKAIAVQVFAGRETGDVFMPVIQRPAEVKLFSKSEN